ncbi:hypothetical protein TSUD_50070 [Trifolium subterraneum]|uniref:non-specific serine/threonine protein kinase n=1 Tax=Trifolium subterraneum TaxID=3900 RepID=A0A2Z6M3X9_TRISU|nr:hypothetical protein TSUD_50070 [Trifolium subterraneum]
MNIYNLAHNQTRVVLFFGCDSTQLPRELQSNRIGCSAENETSSVVALYGDDKNASFVSKNCKDGVVNAMVENVAKGGIEESLRNGFWLNWIATDCSRSLFSLYCKGLPGHPRKGRSRNAKLGIVLGIGITCIFLFGSVFLLLLYKRKHAISVGHFQTRKDNPTHQIIEKFLKEHGPLPAARYSYSDIKKITDSFKNKLGQGGYGCVYKGKLHDERMVAVKVLTESKGGGEDFINEVASISRTSHVNVVRLLGFCLDGSKKALIYEFMPNGSLEKFIYEEKDPLKNDRQLDCKTLYDIAVGIARHFGGVSHKSDVYSYGMMVLEMVGRRKNIKVEVDCSSELYFPHWIYKRLELNQDLGLRCIKNKIDEEMVRKMTVVSLWCIQTDPTHRPAMHKVVEMLEGSLQVLEIPPKPFLSSPSTSPIHLSSEIL